MKCFQALKFVHMANKRTTIVRNMGEILCFCLTRNVALKFNPAKVADGELFTFVNTNLYNVVKCVFFYSVFFRIAWILNSKNSN